MDKIIELVNIAKLTASNSGYVLAIGKDPENEEKALLASKKMEEACLEEIEGLLRYFIDYVLTGKDIC